MLCLGIPFFVPSASLAADCSLPALMMCCGVFVMTSQVLRGMVCTECYSSGSSCQFLSSPFDDPSVLTQTGADQGAEPCCPPVLVVIPLLASAVQGTSWCTQIQERRGVRKLLKMEIDLPLLASFSLSSGTHSLDPLSSLL